MFTRSIIAILCLACFVLSSRADDPPKFKPIDPETVAAYKKLGAQYSEAGADQPPGFLLEPSRDGTLPKLPPVQVPFVLMVAGLNFGLVPYDMGVTDTGMKGLKDLKNLAGLVIESSQLTEAGQQ